MQIESFPVEPRSKHAMPGQRLVIVLSCALIVVGALLLYQRIESFLTSASDFTQDYVAAQWLLDGKSIYSEFTAADLSAEALHSSRSLLLQQGFGNNHPPFNAVLFIPLTWIGYDMALLAWSALSCALYFWIGWMVVRELQIPLKRQWMALLIGLALCWFPFQAHIALGQLSLLVVACIIGGWALLRRQHELAGGALIGLACLIKLFPALIIVYLFMRRRWRAGIAALAIFAAGGLLTLAIVGRGDVIDYFARVAPQDSAVHGLSPINLGVAGVIRRLFTNGPWVGPLIHAPLLATVLVGLASIGVLIVVARQIRHMPPTAESDDRAFALVCLAMLLISPITWQHVFPILLLPFGLLLQRLLAQPDRWHLGLALVSLALLSLPDIEIARALMDWYAPYHMPWFVGLLLVFPTIGLILLWWALASRAQAESAQIQGTNRQ